MPDPRLVTRAQRAATMLERAWERWRSAHGLAAEPLPPVSSYVGYSIEEPWGRPRVVFGVAAEDAERLAAFLQDSLDGGAEAGAGGQWAAGRGGGPVGPAGAERGSLLEDVRGRIPVQSWPEFSEGREQLNSSGAAGAVPARPGSRREPGHRAPGRARPRLRPSQARPRPSRRRAVRGQRPGCAGRDRRQARRNGAAQPDGAGRADGLPAGRTDDGEAGDDLRYDDDDDVQHAAWLSDIRADGDADDDDEYCDTADDLRATPAGPRLAQAGPRREDADRPGRSGASGRQDTPPGGGMARTARPGRAGHQPPGRARRTPGCWAGRRRPA